MKFCSNCGTQLENENQPFCAACGAKTGAQGQPAASAPVYEQPPVQPQEAPAQPQYAPAQPQYTSAQSQYTSAQPQYAPAQPQYAPVAPVAQKSMKWFSFLIYFALFAGAVINLAFGVNYITGDIYLIESDGKVTADLVYAVFFELKTWDIFYGGTLIAMAAYAVFTRFVLAKFKKGAPFCLYVLYIVNIIMSTVYCIIVSDIVRSDNAVSGTTITSIIFSVLMLIFNFIYFQKRKELFVR